MQSSSHARPLAVVATALLVLSAVAVLSTCAAADPLFGIHALFSQVPLPTVNAEATGVNVGDSVTLTASGSGPQAVYNWSISSGGGSIEPTGDTVTFTASLSPETATITVYASVPGIRDSEAVATEVVVSGIAVIGPAQHDVTLNDTASLFDYPSTNSVLPGDSVSFAATGYGTGVTYNWTVTGTGSIDATGDTVTYTAPLTEETATVSVFASRDGYDDSPTVSATINVRENHYALLTSTVTDGGTATNFNQAASIEWTSTTVDGAYFATPSATEIQVLQAGDYFLSLTLPMQSSVQRAAVRAQVTVETVPVDGAIADTGYIRNMSGHNESSNHLAILLPGLSANDRIEVDVSAAGAGGNVTVPGQATLYVEYVDPARVIFSGTANRTTFGVDIYRDTDYPLEWTSAIADPGFTHTTPENVILDDPGFYLVTVNVPTIMGSPSSERHSAEVQVKYGGVTVPGGYARQGYIRNQSGHDSASVHWTGTVHVPSGSEGQALTVTTRREPSTAADVDVEIDGEAALFIERLDPGAYTYSGAGRNLEAGTTWNPFTETGIEWSEGDSLVDTDVYGHSTSTQPSEVTILADGDYLVVYNHALFYETGAAERLNPQIQLLVDATPVTGAQSSAHYIRNYTTVGNRRTSGTLVFYLESLTAGQVLSFTTIAAAETTTNPPDVAARPLLYADEDALLTVIRKR